MKYYILLLLISCGRPSALVFSEPKRPSAFQSLNANFFKTKCVNCHKNFKTEENLLPFITRNDPDSSLLFEVVKDGRMPKEEPPLSTIELEMIRKYIKGVEVIEAVTFEELKAGVLQRNCLECHKRAKDESFVLQKWVNKESLFESKLYTTTLSGSMPKNQPHLSKTEMNLIKGYLKTK